MGECHYLYGNVHAARHLEVVAYLLDLSGIGRARMALKWISAAEGKEFAEYIKRLSDETLDLGPFDPDRYALELAACEKALDSPRLRWLMGMEIQLTEKGNVFHERVEKDRYKALLQKAALSEYEKALISESLGDGPLSVREIALKTGLSVRCVSSRLGELEQRHEAELRHYRGAVPLFANAM